MNAPRWQKLQQEPLNSGIIIGFSVLCTIAFVSLIGSLFFKQDAISGSFLVILAISASLFSGIVAAIAGKKVTARRQAELVMAKSLASGDFSNCVWPAQICRTELSATLMDIAERKLAIERNNGQLIQEAATRESQLASALDCMREEIAVFDKSGLLACANSAYLSKCNTVGAVIALGMTRKEVWSELAKAPRVHLPLNERQSWLNLIEDMRREALTSGAPVRFVRFQTELAQMSVHITKDGHQVEIIENIMQLVQLEERASKAEREAGAMERLKQVTLSRLSHTIRTPMTGVLAAAELLNDSALDTKQRARLDIIRRSAGTLLGVVQDMFDLAETPLSSSRGDVQEGIEVDATENRVKQEQALICSTPADIAQKTGILKLTKNSLPELNPAHASLDVLIVESNEVNQIYFANNLDQGDYCFKIVGTGGVAIQAAKAGKPRLILMDISIPDIDGLRVTAAIRESAENGEPAPVIIGMTNHFVQGDLAKCIKAGMDHYIPKPQTAEGMKSLLQEWLKPEPMKLAG